MSVHDKKETHLTMWSYRFHEAVNKRLAEEKNVTSTAQSVTGFHNAITLSDLLSSYELYLHHHGIKKTPS